MIPPRRPRSPGGLAALAAGVPAALAFLAALPSLGGGLVLDDRWIVRENPRLSDPASLPGLLLENYWGDRAEGGLYRPLTLATFAADRAVFAGSAAGHHLTNALLYAACTGLFSVVALRAGAGSGAALAAGALFAAHPVHTEPVASLVGRAEILALLGALGVLALRLGSSRPPALLSAAAFAAALFSKESAIALLPVLLLLPLVEPGPDGWRRRLLGGTRTHARLWTALGAVVLLWTLLRSTALSGAEVTIPTMDNVLAGRDAWGRAAGALEVSLRYHATALRPWPLSADYSFAAILPGSSLRAPAALAGLAAWGALAWAFTRVASARGMHEGARRLLGLGIALYAFPLLLVANLFFPIGTIFAERLLFAPTAGACLVAAALLTRMFETRALAVPAAIAAGGLVLVGGTLFVRRLPDWENDLTIARSVTRVQPLSAKGQDMHGRALYERAADPAHPERARLLEEARVHLERAVEIAPDYGNAWLHLAYLKARMGLGAEWARAAERYREIEPEELQGFVLLAMAQNVRGAWEETIALTEAGLALHPESGTLRKLLEEAQAGSAKASRAPAPGKASR